MNLKYIFWFINQNKKIILSFESMILSIVFLLQLNLHLYNYKIVCNFINKIYKINGNKRICNVDFYFNILIIF